MKIRCLPFAGLVLAGMMSVSVFASEAESEKYIIGVPVYDLADEQVQGFREYLENYIGVNFENVSFLYSQSINSEEEEMEFLQNCIDAGAKGIMAFNSYDLQAEMELCAANQVYYVRPAGTPSEADFEAVADNPYYLGYFGPGTEMEYQAGYDMGKWYAEQDFGDEYFVLSGGSGLANPMHIERTKGILDALQEVYQVEFDQKSDELAVAAEPLTIEKGDLKVTICSGYLNVEAFLDVAKEAYEQNPCQNVLSVIPVSGMIDVLGDAKLGIIDCYTSQNAQLYNEGKLQYLCGKYNSIIGPAFATMYNALTGYAEDFRDNGKAFAIVQGFWTSDSKEDFEEKYVLSCGIARNAYSYTDLLDIIKVYNANAALDDVKSLAEAWDFESAKARAEK